MISYPSITTRDVLSRLQMFSPDVWEIAYPSVLQARFPTHDSHSHEYLEK